VTINWAGDTTPDGSGGYNNLLGRHCSVGSSSKPHQVLSFKFRFLGSGQIVSNQNLLLVTDQSSGTHNQNQNFSLI
jgi:hypothetical protein